MKGWATGGRCLLPRGRVNDKEPVVASAHDEQPVTAVHDARVAVEPEVSEHHLAAVVVSDDRGGADFVQVVEHDDLLRPAERVGGEEVRAGGDAAPVLAHGADAERGFYRQPEEDLGQDVFVVLQHADSYGGH